MAGLLLEQVDSVELGEEVLRGREGRVVLVRPWLDLLDQSEMGEGLICLAAVVRGDWLQHGLSRAVVRGRVGPIRTARCLAREIVVAQVEGLAVLVDLDTASVFLLDVGDVARVELLRVQQRYFCLRDPSVVVLEWLGLVAIVSILAI